MRRAHAYCGDMVKVPTKQHATIGVEKSPTETGCIATNGPKPEAPRNFENIVIDEAVPIVSSSGNEGFDGRGIFAMCQCVRVQHRHRQSWELHTAVVALYAHWSGRRSKLGSQTSIRLVHAEVHWRLRREGHTTNQPDEAMVEASKARPHAN